LIYLIRNKEKRENKRKNKMIDFGKQHPFADLEIICDDGSLWYSRFTFSLISEKFTSMDKTSTFGGIHKSAMMIILNIFCLQDVKKIIPNYDELCELAGFSKSFNVPKVTAYVYHQIIVLQRDNIDLNQKATFIINYCDLFNYPRWHIEIINYFKNQFVNLPKDKIAKIQPIVFTMFSIIRNNDCYDNFRIWATENSDKISDLVMWKNIDHAIMEYQKAITKVGDKKTERLICISSFLIDIIELSSDTDFKKDMIYKIVTNVNH
jgi:hypothetical protein